MKVSDGFKFALGMWLFKVALAFAIGFAFVVLMGLLTEGVQ